MGLNTEYEEGQTPLDADEKDGLLIPSITTRSEPENSAHISTLSWKQRKP